MHRNSGGEQIDDDDSVSPCMVWRHRLGKSDTFDRGHS